MVQAHHGLPPESVVLAKEFAIKWIANSFCFLTSLPCCKGRCKEISRPEQHSRVRRLRTRMSCIPQWAPQFTRLHKVSMSSTSSFSYRTGRKSKMSRGRARADRRDATMGFRFAAVAVDGGMGLNSRCRAHYSNLSAGKRDPRWPISCARLTSPQRLPTKVVRASVGRWCRL